MYRRFFGCESIGKLCEKVLVLWSFFGVLTKYTTLIFYHTCIYKNVFIFVN